MVPYNTVSYITVPNIIVPYITVPYIKVPYITMPYITVSYITVPYIIVHYITVPYITQCLTLQCLTLHSALHYNALHYSVLHYSAWHEATLILVSLFHAWSPHVISTCMSKWWEYPTAVFPLAFPLPLTPHLPPPPPTLHPLSVLLTLSFLLFVHLSSTYLSPLALVIRGFHPSPPVRFSPKPSNRCSSINHLRSIQYTAHLYLIHLTSVQHSFFY